MRNLVWLIGKPGSGKTTVGKMIEANNLGSVYYSFSDLLKQFQPIIAEEGFLQESRDKVYSFLKNEAKTKTVIVSGNPYTPSSFQEMLKVSDNFIVIHFLISDDKALARMIARGRGVLYHDGASQEERLRKFNKNVLPLIEEISSDDRAYTIDVEAMKAEDIQSFIEEVSGLV